MRSALIATMLLVGASARLDAFWRSAIKPLRAQIQFSSACSANSWVGYLDSDTGSEYKLVLEPVYAAYHRLVGWDLAVYRLGGHRNLLEPRGRWHGLQAFNIVAQDLIAGPQKSAFGRQRAFRLAREGILVTLTVEGCTVLGSAAEAVFDDLEVTVAADALR